MGQIFAEADDMGFEIDPFIINAADFGAPQIRRRCVILGWRKSAANRPERPQATHSKSGGPGLFKWKSVRDAISDLEPPVGTSIRDVPPPYDLHFGRSPTELSVTRYKLVPEGGNRFHLQARAPHLTPRCWLEKPTGGTDIFGRLVWDQPSVTVRTEFWKPEKGRYLHPNQHRPITHREAARLMGFPDEFRFCGSKVEIARQIGNAVPPLIAEALAAVLANFLDVENRALHFSACAA
jgi:DNA (cytosine-5)-methyltransferase 1